MRRKGSDEVLVMKAVSLQGLSEKDREDTLNEAKLMKQLKHENLIRQVNPVRRNLSLSSFSCPSVAPQATLKSVIVQAH